MWRIFVFSCVSLCFAVAATTSSSAALQPWKAAEAVLRTLPESFRLQTVDSDAVEVFCGQQLRLGLQVDDRLYQVHVGREDGWQRLELPPLVSPFFDAVAQESDAKMSLCSLPEMTLSGPLEIEWTHPTHAVLRFPPESETIHDVERLVLEDGAHVKLRGMTTLELKDSVALRGVGSEYWDLIYGRGGKEMMGLMQMSAAVQQDAQNSGMALQLRGRASTQGITISHLAHHPVQITQTAPGTLSVYPDKVALDHRGQVTSPTCWPFPNASASEVLPYESLLRQVLSHHRPEIDPTRASLALNTAVSQAMLLLRLQMEVRSETGPAQMLDAHVLVHDDQYLPLHTQPIKSQQYVATISPYDVMNTTMDPELPLYDIYL